MTSSGFATKVQQIINHQNHNGEKIMQNIHYILTHLLDHIQNNQAQALLQPTLQWLLNVCTMHTTCFEGLNGPEAFSLCLWSCERLISCYKYSRPQDLETIAMIAKYLLHSFAQKRLSSHYVATCLAILKAFENSLEKIKKLSSNFSDPFLMLHTSTATLAGSQYRNLIFKGVTAGDHDDADIIFCIICQVVVALIPSYSEYAPEVLLKLFDLLCQCVEFASLTCKDVVLKGIQEFLSPESSIRDVVCMSAGHLDYCFDVMNALLIAGVKNSFQKYLENHSSVNGKIWPSLQMVYEQVPSLRLHCQFQQSESYKFIQLVIAQNMEYLAVTLVELPSHELIDISSDILQIYLNVVNIFVNEMNNNNNRDNPAESLFFAQLFSLLFNWIVRAEWSNSFMKSIVPLLCTLTCRILIFAPHISKVPGLLLDKLKRQFEILSNHIAENAHSELLSCVRILRALLSCVAAASVHDCVPHHLMRPLNTILLDTLNKLCDHVSKYLQQWNIHADELTDELTDHLHSLCSQMVKLILFVAHVPYLQMLWKRRKENVSTLITLLSGWLINPSLCHEEYLKNTISRLPTLKAVDGHSALCSTLLRLICAHPAPSIHKLAVYLWTHSTFSLNSPSSAQNVLTSIPYILFNPLNEAHSLSMCRHLLEQYCAITVKDTDAMLHHQRHLLQHMELTLATACGWVHMESVKSLSHVNIDYCCELSISATALSTVAMPLIQDVVNIFLSICHKQWFSVYLTKDILYLFFRLIKMLPSHCFLGLLHSVQVALLRILQKNTCSEFGELVAFNLNLLFHRFPDFAVRKLVNDCFEEMLQRKNEIPPDVFIFCLTAIAKNTNDAAVLEKIIELFVNYAVEGSRFEWYLINSQLLELSMSLQISTWDLFLQNKRLISRVVVSHAQLSIPTQLDVIEKVFGIKTVSIMETLLPFLILNLIMEGHSHNHARIQSLISSVSKLDASTEYSLHVSALNILPKVLLYAHSECHENPHSFVRFKSFMQDHFKMTYTSIWHYHDVSRYLHLFAAHLYPHLEEVKAAFKFIAVQVSGLQGTYNASNFIATSMDGMFPSACRLLNTSSPAERSDIALSMACLIELLGTEQVTMMRTKFVSTLSLCLQLCPDETKISAAVAWCKFIDVVDLKQVGPMLPEMVAFFVSFVDAIPLPVCGLLKYLVDHCRGELNRVLSEFHFLPKSKLLESINKTICAYGSQDDSLKRFLQLSVGSMRHESLGVRRECLQNAIYYLTKLSVHIPDMEDLDSCGIHQSAYLCMLLQHSKTANECVRWLDELFTCLLETCSYDNHMPKMPLLYGKVFGLLGPVDPSRFSICTRSRGNRRSDKTDTGSNLFLDDRNFTFELLIEIGRAHLHTKESFVTSWIIQELLSLLKVPKNCSLESGSYTNEECFVPEPHHYTSTDDVDARCHLYGAALWHKLPLTLKNSFAPLLNSHYGLKRSTVSEVPTKAIFSLDKDSTFEEWIQEFVKSFGVFTKGKEGKLFRTCESGASLDVGFAKFLITKLALHVFIENEMNGMKHLFREIMTVLNGICEAGSNDVIMTENDNANESNVGGDALPAAAPAAEVDLASQLTQAWQHMQSTGIVNTFMPTTTRRDPALLSDSEDNAVKETGTWKPWYPLVAQTIFSLIDNLQLWLHERSSAVHKREPSSSKSTCSNGGGGEPLLEGSNLLDDVRLQTCSRVKLFLECIPHHLQALVASRCGSHARCILYWELAYREAKLTAPASLHLANTSSEKEKKAYFYRKMMDNVAPLRCESFLPPCQFKTSAETVDPMRGEYVQLIPLQHQSAEIPPESVIPRSLHGMLRAFSALHASDGLAGLLALSEWDIGTSLRTLEMENLGQMEMAAVEYEQQLVVMDQINATADDVSKLVAYEGLLRCQLHNVSNLNGIVERMSALSKRSSQRWRDRLSAYRAQAICKLGQWKSLPEVVDEFANVTCWPIGMAKMFNHLHNKKYSEVQELLDHMIVAEMNPIGAAAMESGSFDRIYEELTRLGMLVEVQITATVLRSILPNNGENEEQLSYCQVPAADAFNPLITFLNNRSSVCESTYHITEPLLSFRHSLLHLCYTQVLAVSQSAGDYVDQTWMDLVKSLEKALGGSWLRQAKMYRKENQLMSAYSCILHAESLQSPVAFMERAKLLWTQGHTEDALNCLDKAIDDQFGDLEECLKAPTEDARRLFCAEVFLMRARYCEEGGRFDFETISKLYSDTCTMNPHSEEAYFRLAAYTEKAHSQMHSGSNKDALLQTALQNYGRALTLGCQFTYQTMPRFLGLWLDYSACVSDTASISSPFHAIHRMMTSHINLIPAFQYYTALGQILSRLCHPNHHVADWLLQLTSTVFAKYHEQCIWFMLWILESTVSQRQGRARDLFAVIKKKFPHLTRFIDDSVTLARNLSSLCKLHTDSRNQQPPKSVQLSSVSRPLSRIFSQRSYSRMVIPLHHQLVAELPCGDWRDMEQHYPFPNPAITLEGFEERIDILTSLTRPKKMSWIGSNGNRYFIVCKPDDDLRKDSRLMEFNSLIGKLLLRDPESRRRQLRIRTYAVIPLSEKGGIIEWVNHTNGFRNILLALYKEIGAQINWHEARNIAPKREDSVAKMKNIFLTKLVPMFPIVFHRWFLQNFPDPCSWYNARTNYARTSAVMSMVGYILGLGDRHGENILLDSKSGDVVHVDFNCLFNHGLSFQWPELVPFRLTRNMLDGMGAQGCEGTFRRTCEIVMRILRAENEPLMAVFRPMYHDSKLEEAPFKYDSKQIRLTSGASNANNINDPQSKLDKMECRLRGILTERGALNQLPMSVEGQVDALISEAMDVNLLCQMFFGWAPFL